MKHKTLNGLLFFTLLSSSLLADNWPNTQKKIEKIYSFDAHHKTYKIFSDSLYYIISNISNEDYSKKNPTIIIVNQKGDLKKNKKITDLNGYILSATKLTNGSFLFIGNNKPNNERSKIWIIKTDQYLNTTWIKSYGSDNHDNRGYSIIEFNEKEYWVLGNTEASKNNALILKIDNNGNEKWFSYLQKLNCTFATHMIINQKKEVVIGGQNANQLFVSKIDNEGNILWNYNYRNYNNKKYRLYEIKNTKDGGVIIAGNTNENFKKDILIIKLTADGKESWVKIIKGHYSEIAYDIEEIRNSEYIIGGYALKDKKGELYNSFIIKTDSLGHELSRMNLNHLPSNKLYDIDIKYNKNTNITSYFGVGDITNNGKDQILFIKFDEKH